MADEKNRSKAAAKEAEAPQPQPVYTVLQNLDHSGHLYVPGDEVTFTADEIASGMVQEMLDNGTVIFGTSDEAKAALKVADEARTEARARA